MCATPTFCRVGMPAWHIGKLDLLKGALSGKNSGTLIGYLGMVVADFDHVPKAPTKGTHMRVFSTFGTLKSPVEDLSSQLPRGKDGTCSGKDFISYLFPR